MLNLIKPSGLFTGVYSAPRALRACPGFPGRAAFIADLHLRRGHEDMAEKTLRLLDEFGPEAVFLGGDLSEYDEGLEVFLAALRRHFPFAPAFAVPGNNDDEIFGGLRERQKRVYDKYSVSYLLNEGAPLKLSGGRARVFGCEDAYSHTPAIDGCFDGAAEEYRLLLCHEPLKGLLASGADLILSGHTHGGQINVLGLTCYQLFGYEHRFSFALYAGEKQFGSARFIVSRGIGWSKYPIRFGARSDIILLGE